MKKTFVVLAAILSMSTMIGTYAKTEEKRNIEDILHIGDIYENTFYSDDDINVSVVEMVTKINKDGTFEAEALGELLEKSGAYTVNHFEADGEENYTSYVKKENMQIPDDLKKCLDQLTDADIVSAKWDEELKEIDDLIIVQQFIAGNAENLLIQQHRIGVSNIDEFQF